MIDWPQNVLISITIRQLCIWDLSMMETLLFLLSFCWYLPWKIKHGWWNKHTIDWLIDLKNFWFHSQSDNFVSVISVWWRPMQTTSKPLSTIARDKWLVSFQSLRGLADISYDAPCTFVQLACHFWAKWCSMYLQLKTVNIKRHCFRREAENWWASLWDASQIRGWTVETGQTGPDNGFKLLNTEY